MKVEIATYIKQLLIVGRKHKDIWLYLSNQDLNSQFRRSKLGVWWLLVNQLTFAIGAGLIWSAVFNIDPMEFIPFITSGFAIWGFILAMFVDSGSSFLNAQGFIKQVALPLPIYVFRHIYTSLIRFAIGFSVAALVVVLLGEITISGVLLSIFGIFLVLLLGVFVSLFFAYICSRYQDVQFAISNVFQMLFVLTPIIYPPEILIQKGLGFAVYLNPLSSIIQVIRVPLIEGSPAPIYDYMLVLVYLIISIFASYSVGKKLERKVVYYL